MIITVPIEDETFVLNYLILLYYCCDVPNSSKELALPLWYTASFTKPQKKKPKGIRTSDLIGQAIGPRLPIHLSMYDEHGVVLA
ncbi:hypothetical protein ANN_21121 [Periplaneta americana]|uniref:Uncharacterized protein n=1 Tax=Periplaneta americana TaxID=6978 RepID=A0ABQ8SFM8_PERAM|nr:hypothetical protein ANN_21121 [Periplaneta americana]